MIQDEDEVLSTFSYDGEADPDTFSLHQLRVAVNHHFHSTPCRLAKLAEGGYHKVYDILQDDGSSLGVVRVASPAFPKDKLESEVAILIYLAAHTQIPVPWVYAWNSDASNPVGAEYMILQKLPGVSADKEWGTLSISVKERIVSQIATHLKSLFGLRFDRAGSPYLSSSSGNDLHVGPIVTSSFYRAHDGVVRVAEPSLSTELSHLRGPFPNTSDYLQSSLRAELFILSRYRSVVLTGFEEKNEEVAQRQLEAAQRVLGKALKLCTIYPGDHQPGEKIDSPAKPFSIQLDDFRLSNIMIDARTGAVTGLIDFEGVTVAPLWECAVVPSWLLDPDDDEGAYEGGSAEDRERLREIFFGSMASEEWRGLYEYGKPFRHFKQMLSLRASVWVSRDVEEWVDEKLAWAEVHPGVALLDELFN